MYRSLPRPYLVPLFVSPPSLALFVVPFVEADPAPVVAPAAAPAPAPAPAAAPAAAGDFMAQKEAEFAKAKSAQDAIAAENKAIAAAQSADLAQAAATGKAPRYMPKVGKPVADNAPVNASKPAAEDPKMKKMGQIIAKHKAAAEQATKVADELNRKLAATADEAAIAKRELKDKTHRLRETEKALTEARQRKREIKRSKAAAKSRKNLLAALRANGIAPVSQTISPTQRKPEPSKTVSTTLRFNLDVKNITNIDKYKRTLIKGLASALNISPARLDVHTIKGVAVKQAATPAAPVPATAASFIEMEVEVEESLDAEAETETETETETEAEAEAETEESTEDFEARAFETSMEMDTAPMSQEEAEMEAEDQLMAVDAFALAESRAEMEAEEELQAEEQADAETAARDAPAPAPAAPAAETPAAPAPAAPAAETPAAPAPAAPAAETPAAPAPAAPAAETPAAPAAPAAEAPAAPAPAPATNATKPAAPKPAPEVEVQKILVDIVIHPGNGGPSDAVFNQLLNQITSPASALRKTKGLASIDPTFTPVANVKVHELDSVSGAPVVKNVVLAPKAPGALIRAVVLEEFPKTIQTTVPEWVASPNGFQSPEYVAVAVAPGIVHPTEI